MAIFTYICILVGSVILLLGYSNKTKKPQRGEKTTVGKVEAFGLIDNGKKYPTHYRAIIKAGLKKYTIESVTMPWLNKGEEVLIQMTGKQKVLGNERLNNRSKVELFLGLVIIVFSFVIYFAK